MTKVITICNGKGGTGKTTVAVLFAHALVQAGGSVALLDLDPQRTASRWIEASGAPIPAYSEGGSWSYVLVDTPPRLDSPALAQVLQRTALAVIVSSPSPADLWATQDTVAAVRKLLPAGAEARLLFNAVQANTVLARGLPDMAERIGLAAIGAALARRQCYQHAALLGWSGLTVEAREELQAAVIETIGNVKG